MDAQTLSTSTSMPMSVPISPDHPVCSTRHFRAMGSAASITLVEAEPAALEQAGLLAQRRIEHLEQCWSRFIPTSDISRLNSAGGVPVVVDPSTVELISSMLRAWRATAGLFDPTLLGALNSLGYAADWDDPSRCSSGPANGWRATPDEIEVDPGSCSVRLPIGASLDAGGIGKGLAADLAAAAASEAGVGGVLVALGGDLRVRGTAPQPGGWSVGVADPFGDDHEIARLRLLDGGVATSSTQRRRWLSPSGGLVHHLLDPGTNAPATTDVVQATVVAGTAAWAEAWTKAIMISGPHRTFALLDRLGLAALAIDGAGVVVANEMWARYAVRSTARTMEATR